jgi:hypothetical protein
MAVVVTSPAYAHRQTAPLCLLVYGTAVWLCVAAWLTQSQPPLALTLLGTGVAMALLGLAIHHLTVEDQGDRLAICFGPLPLFRRMVRYADMAGVEVGRTLLLEGWGIHYSLRGGWVWNLWGRDCVVIRLNDGGTLRVGTDDASNLARFLEGRIADRSA